MARSVVGTVVWVPLLKATRVSVLGPAVAIGLGG